jgi:hypothetical protein
MPRIELKAVVPKNEKTKILIDYCWGNLQGLGQFHSQSMHGYTELYYSTNYPEYSIRFIEKVLAFFPDAQFFKKEDKSRLQVLR